MNRERRIGLTIDAVSAYGRGVIRGILAYTRAHPAWRIAVAPRWSFELLPPLDKWEVDGLIVQSYSREFEDSVSRRGLAATNVSNFLPESVLPTVVPDDRAVGKMAAEYLLSRGFRDLGFCGPGDLGYARLRQAAFREAVLGAGRACHVCDTREQPIIDWLRQLPKPAAVMACNDDWAYRVLADGDRAGLKVPDEIAVLGVDNDELFNALVKPSLSSVALATEKVGYEAAAALDRLLNGETVPPLTTIAPRQVVTRESTEVLALEDAEVAAAMSFIRRNSNHPLGVGDLLDHLPLSRRSLERRFRDTLGRSVSAEIRRAHVERAKQLLLDTDMTISQIATAAGFATPTRFGIVFHREVGVPPSAFRNQFRTRKDGK